MTKKLKRLLDLYFFFINVYTNDHMKCTGTTRNDMIRENIFLPDQKENKVDLE